MAYKGYAHHRKLLHLCPKFYSTVAFLEVDDVNKPALKELVTQLTLEGYSKSTIKTYSQEFLQLLKILKTHEVNSLSAEKQRSYFLYCHQKLRLSENLIHSRMNAIKFYFEKVLKKDKIFLDVPRPKKAGLLPKALSTTDIKRMLMKEQNLKHALLLKLCYGLGLRVSEIVNLKITDIDSGRMQVLISRAKGKKDRYVILPDSILNHLREYYQLYRPKIYLFEGQNGDQYAVRSAQQVFYKAMRNAGINKKVGVHALRHSYATHLIEQGTDIRFVQELLGHASLKTTMIYTHLTDSTKRKIKSPLDHIDL